MYKYATLNVVGHNVIDFTSIMALFVRVFFTVGRN